MNILNTVYFSNKNYWNLSVCLLLIIGFAFRIFHFIYNRSLWIDEVYLSTSLVKMDFLELATKPLYYQQKAPIGFLWLNKLVINLFGNTEIFLRLIPLISGVASMLLFVPISKYFLNNWGRLIAIGIISFSPALIYHSVEIKQYSTELFCTLLSLYMFIKYNQSTELKGMFQWGVIGATILWFSHSAIFILSGIAIGLGLKYLLEKKWKSLFLSLIPFTIWLISFLINYTLFTHKHVESKWIVYWFRSYANFMPFPPKSLTDLTWFPLNLYRMIDYPLGLLWNFNSLTNNPPLNQVLKMPFIGIGLLFIGVYNLCRRNKAHFSILIPPIIITLIASSLELYPLTERFWVFLSPILILIIAFGFDYLIKGFKSKRTIVLLLIIVLFGPFYQSLIFTFKPETFYVHKKSFQREALIYLNNNYRKNDIVYIYWNDLPGYKLYKDIYHLNFNAVEGTDVRQQSKDLKDYYKNLEPDFNQLSGGKRIWLIYNTMYTSNIGDKIDDPSWYYQKNHNSTDDLVKELLRFGPTLKKYKTKDITVYLIDNNKKK
ncbi:glycosyltransferase family 39 protein [Pedobacter hiemivivus]|uniref:Glycosyltransferase family 39 protein n=2 Tax=Pedobacter hiemivivus TaxID=2530454 RepID=A0A4U1G663_9SPHI|nr:glycosyltransferase family 39 protein [Pedobacter hiemivivus]